MVEGQCELQVVELRRQSNMANMDGVHDLVALVVHPWRAAPPLRAQNGSEAKMAHCLGNPLNYLGPLLNYVGQP